MTKHRYSEFALTITLRPRLHAEIKWVQKAMTEPLLLRMFNNLCVDNDWFQIEDEVTKRGNIHYHCYLHLVSIEYAYKVRNMLKAYLDEAHEDTFGFIDCKALRSEDDVIKWKKYITKTKPNETYLF